MSELIPEPTGGASPTIDWSAMRESAGPYPIDAFHFVREGLTYTVERIHAELDDVTDPAALATLDRHISGQQLCLGLRDFAIDQYGYLAPLVLEQWNVRRTDDFGRIVFAMIEAGLMSKTDQDSLDDFRLVYDFAEAFSQDELARRIGAVNRSDTHQTSS